MNENIEIVLSKSQQKAVCLPLDTPTKIAGVAGSGKTLVAVHRAKHIISHCLEHGVNPKVAIFTFNKSLVAYINNLVSDVFIGENETKPVVTNFHKWAYDYLNQHNQLSDKKILDSRNDDAEKLLNNLLRTAFNTVPEATPDNLKNKSLDFFFKEINIIKAKNINSFENYYPQKSSLKKISSVDRRYIWDVYESYSKLLKANNYIDFNDFSILCNDVIDNNVDFKPCFSHIIIDEAQDLSYNQISLLLRIVENKNLTIIADASQTIYNTGFNWKSLSIQFSKLTSITLEINYRNPKQICFASLNLIKDLPTIQYEHKVFYSNTNRCVTEWFIGQSFNKNDSNEYLLKKLNEMKINENSARTVIITRTTEKAKIVSSFLNNNSHPNMLISGEKKFDFRPGGLFVCTMHSVKGLEFENVIIFGLDQGEIPFDPYSKGLTSEELLNEVRLLYTCLTRAKNNLILISSGDPSFRKRLKSYFSTNSVWGDII